MDDKTIKTYNQMAKEYDDETIDFWDRFPSTFIDKFKESVVKNGKVLDVGSGPGRDGLILKKNGFDIICLDASESMVNLCKDRGLSAVVGDLMSLPFKDKEFDAVWAYTSLLHISKKDIPKAIFEIRKVLKPNGIFALGMIEGDKEEYKTSAGIDKPRLFAFYSKKEIEKLLNDASFEVFHFEQFTPGSKNYLNYLCKKL